jgi:hypothetical protein
VHSGKYHIEAPPNMRMQPDRFAREIVAILVLSGAARSRRLMRNPVARYQTPKLRWRNLACNERENPYA